MKRTLLMMILAMAGIFAVQAQGVLKLGKKSAPMLLSTANKTAIEPSDNQKWWGYVDVDEPIKIVGMNSKETYLCAIYVPGTNLAAAGKEIKAIRFAMYASNAKNVKVWLANSLPNAINKNSTLEFVNVSDVEMGYNDVALSKGYTIGSEGIYVGYSFSIDKLENDYDRYPICVAGTDVPNSLLLRTSSSQQTWTELSGYGSLCLQVLLDGDFPYQNAAFASDVAETFTAVGQTVDVELPVTNLGNQPLTSIDYTVANGEAKHAELAKALSYGQMAYVTISVDADKKSGTQKKVIKITKANGVDNEITSSDANGTLTLSTLSKMVPRGIAVEEFTGTGCGYCPRGLVGMEKLRQEFGDQFVGIGIHGYNSSDPMYFEWQKQYPSIFSGSAPSCQLNRAYGEIDPYYGTGSDIREDFRDQLAICAKVGLEVTGEWNADSTAIDATATVEGLIDGGEFTIEYMLIADGLKGEGSSWRQSNYYNGQGSLPEDMQFLSSAGSYYYTVFNDVCIATSYVSGKNKATALGKVNDGVVKTNNFTLTMPTKPALLQAIDKEQVAVVALLVNKDGTIANAAKFYMRHQEVPEEPVIADGTYYLKNKGTDKFLAAGHSWGTRSIVNADGLDITIAKAEDGKYTLDTQVFNSAVQHFLGTNLYVDADATGWTIEAVGDGFYTISNEAGYLAVGDNDETVQVAEVNDNALWAPLTYEERLASVEVPADLTFVIRDANFNRNDHRKDAWETWSENAEGKPNFNISGGNNENNNAESYHAKFSLTQTIEGLPNGVYEMTVQGFCRIDEGDYNAENMPYFFINDQKVAFPEKTGEENNMSDASVSFTAGLYTTSPVRVTVTDGKITLGAKNEENLNLWCIWDNFRLTYLGEPNENLLELTINHEREVGLGYTPTEATVDFAEAKAFLGVDEVTNSMLSFVNPDGTEIPYDAYMAANYDGWCNGDGFAENWGANTKICVKFFEAIPNGTFTFYDMNKADEVGKTYKVKWCLANGEKSVQYTINVKFIEKQNVIYSPDIIAFLDVPVVMAPATAYEGLTATFPQNEVASLLGLNSITEAKQYIINLTDFNFVKNTTDGWRDAQGDAATWGSGEGMVCVKINDPSSGIIDYLGAIDETHKEGDTYTAAWGFVNANEKAVMVKVNITFANSVIANGDLEGENMVNFFSKEAPSTDIVQATAVEGAGRWGTRGIVVKSSDNPAQAWDTQFFIKVNEKLPEGTKLHVEFDYMADREASTSTQSHSEPGSYLHWACIGNPIFSTEWQHRSADVTVEGAMADMQTIAFNLSEDANATEYHFDNFIIWIQKPAPVDDWVNILANSDLEGTDASSFFSKEAPSTDVVPSTIYDGAGVDGSRGIKVTSPAGASQDWDTQFWIYLPCTLPEGTKYLVEFDYKADKDASADTQAHAEPGNYIFYSMIGSPSFTTEWQHYSKTGSITADQAGSDDKLMRSIAFNLSKDKANDVTFFFDNIKFCVEKAFYETGIFEVPAVEKTVNAIYNLRGQKVDKPTKGGIYIINGKKVVVK